VVVVTCNLGRLRLPCFEVPVLVGLLDVINRVVFMVVIVIVLVCVVGIDSAAGEIA
jgi:hypothetical protein